MLTLELSEINQIVLGKLGLVLPVALRSDMNEEITCQTAQRFKRSNLSCCYSQKFKVGVWQTTVRVTNGESWSSGDPFRVSRFMLNIHHALIPVGSTRLLSELTDR